MTVQASDQAAPRNGMFGVGFRRIFFRILPPLLFVLAVHFVALSDASGLSVMVLVGVCLANAATAGLGIGLRAGVVWLCLSGLMGLMLIGVNGGPPILTNLVVLPAIAINGMMLWAFGRTLRPGRMPLIEKMSRLELGEIRPDLVSYTRRLTLAWTLLFAATFLASIVLAMLGDLALWSWIMNFGVPALVVLFFLGEHAYRVPRFGTDSPTSPLQTLRAAMRPSAWTEDT